MAATTLQGIVGYGVDHPRTLERAVRRWGVSDPQRTRILESMLELATDADALPSLRIAASRVVVAIDAIDARRERSEVLDSQGNAALALSAVRTQLAAQLAADPTALARLSTGQTVIPSPPASVQQSPSDATSTPPTPSGDAQPFPHGKDSPPIACERCQDARVIVSSRGATPCPDCCSDDREPAVAVCPACKRPMPESPPPERAARSRKKRP